MTDTRGVFRKFDVVRLDGKDSLGEKHHGCRYFVLDLDHDPGAKAALRSYADFHAQSRPQLAADIYRTIESESPGSTFENLMDDDGGERG